jgi:hypothetical protein
MMWFVIPWTLGLISVFCLMVTMFGLMDKDRTVDGAEVLIGLMIAATWPVSLPSLGLFALLIVAFGKNAHSPIRFKPRN